MTEPGLTPGDVDSLAAFVAWTLSRLDRDVVLDPAPSSGEEIA